MKFKSLKKLFAGLMIGIAAFALAGCQTTEKTATISTKDSTCQVLIVDGQKRCRVMLAFVNPTIYNATRFSIDYKTYDILGDVVTQETGYEFEAFVSHGVAGYAYSEFNIDARISSAEITGAKCVAYQDVWQTYLAWWIIMIVVVGVALCFYAANLFARGLTIDDLKTLLSENFASSLVIAGLLLIISIIPLIFQSWMVTVIIAGGYVGFLALSAGLTGLRALTVKK